MSLSAEVVIIGDDNILYTSQVDYKSSALDIKLDVSQINKLEIKVNNLRSDGYLILNNAQFISY